MHDDATNAAVIAFSPLAADPAEAASHLPDYPETLFDRLTALPEMGQAGLRVLDLATGTGAIARGFARRGCFVTALDTTESLLDEAAFRDRRAGVYVDHRIGGAEHLPVTPGQTDLACCGRAWAGLDDRLAAAKALHRALRPGGWVALIGFSPLWPEGGAARAGLDVLRQRVPDWPGPVEAAQLTWLDDLHVAGFTQVQGQVADVPVMLDHTALGHMLLSQPGLPARLDGESRARLQQVLQRVFLRDFPTQPVSIAHRLWIALGRRG